MAGSQRRRNHAPVSGRLQVDVVDWIGRFRLAVSNDDVLSGNRQ